FGNQGCDWETFCQLEAHCEIGIDEATAMEAIHATEHIRKCKGRHYQPMRGSTVAQMLHVTAEARAALDTRRISAVDETPEQAAARRQASTAKRQRKRWANMSTQERQQRRQEQRVAMSEEERERKREQGRERQRLYRERQRATMTAEQKHEQWL